MADPVWSTTNLGVQMADVQLSEIWVRRAADETWVNVCVDNRTLASFRMPNVYADRLAYLLKGETVIVSKAEDKRMDAASEAVASYMKSAAKLLKGDGTLGTSPPEPYRVYEVAKMIQKEVHRGERKS